MNTNALTQVTKIASSQAAVFMANQFQNCARKTAVAFLEMAKLVTDAQSQLKDWEFLQFCGIIGYDSKSATIRKFSQIGKKYEFLSAHSDHLPSSWTTIYSLSRLEDTVIEAKINEGVITPALSGDDLKNKLGLASKSNFTDVKAKVIKTVPNGTQAADYSFRARLSGTPTLGDRAAIKHLIQSMKDLNLEVELGASLEEFLEDAG